MRGSCEDAAAPRSLPRSRPTEDLAFGERILAFDVYVAAEGGYAKHPVLAASGTAVGHKIILYFASGPMLATGVTVTATVLRSGADVPHYRALRVYAPCAGDNE